MKNLSKVIESTINDQIKIINQKITGTGFLEILKNNLLNNLPDNLNKINNDDIQKINLKTVYEDTSKIITAEFIHYISQKMQLNLKLSENLLIICLAGMIKIDIQDNITKKNVVINLNTNNGITLSKNSTFNINYLKNSLILIVNHKDKIFDIENKNENTI